MKQPNSVATSDLILRETASQTAGPYVHIGLALSVAGLPERKHEIWNRMASPDADGEHIEIVGHVVDGNGDLVGDALIEAWQADASGQYQPVYSHKNAFNSFGRTATIASDENQWRLSTIKPGKIKLANGKVMAPHINLSIFARGINIHLQTRLYFEDEAEANSSCPVLNAVESKARQNTLIATKEASTTSGHAQYRFNVRLQGDNETVFFDF